MAFLIAGLALFIVVHLVPTRPSLRAGLVGTLGPGIYRGLFALVSIAGLVLIVLGYGHMQGLGRGNPQLRVPPVWIKHVVFLLMIPAIILLVAAYVPSRIRTAVGHPMLTALMIWAFAHLLANGDLASVLLFGSFLGISDGQVRTLALVCLAVGVIVLLGARPLLFASIDPTLAAWAPNLLFGAGAAYLLLTVRT